MKPPSRVVGRFAPSPTGPLHFGSLVAAVGSYLSARRAGGVWLVRIEDVDRPRCVPGAADAILRALEDHALLWDGQVMWQSRRTAAYAAALDTLSRNDLTYGCACSRREIGARPYPGTCRNGPPPGRRPRAIRLRTDHARLTIDDAVQGCFTQDVESAVGDFVLRRADGIHAYHLAVVVDDGAQGVTEVVRGADLLDSTPRQVLLQRHLDLPRPAYAHLPVVVDAGGDKLGKQTRAPALDPRHAGSSVHAALCFLGHRPPPALRGAPAAHLVEWALSVFDLSRVAPAPTAPAPDTAATGVLETW